MGSSVQTARAAESIGFSSESTPTSESEFSCRLRLQLHLNARCIKANAYTANMPLIWGVFK